MPERCSEIFAEIWQDLFGIAEAARPLQLAPAAEVVVVGGAAVVVHGAVEVPAVLICFIFADDWRDSRYISVAEAHGP